MAQRLVAGLWEQREEYLEYLGRQTGVAAEAEDLFGELLLEAQELAADPPAVERWVRVRLATRLRLWRRQRSGRDAVRSLDEPVAAASSEELTLLDTIAAPGPSVANQVGGQVLLAVVRRVLRRLPRGSRQLLRRVANGRALRTAGPAQTRQRLRRARQRLALALPPEVQRELLDLLPEARERLTRGAAQRRQEIHERARRGH
ncbi:MAG: hypothetical protein IT204_03090 [Fimbriimonadaceae bacterium]|nr:hypothetical protein [Fimbriimonadaceae bacterium]